MTHILDRLEKRGFVERVRDSSDRRKVLVRALPEGIALLIPRYEAIGRAYMKLLDQYTDKELGLICDYLEKSSELTARQLERETAANRSAADEGSARSRKKAADRNTPAGGGK
jgi:DNA-binding MarR family transcriptional regulator